MVKKKTKRIIFTLSILSIIIGFIGLFLALTGTLEFAIAQPGRTLDNIPIYPDEFQQKQTFNMGIYIVPGYTIGTHECPRAPIDGSFTINGRVGEQIIHLGNKVSFDLTRYAYETCSGGGCQFSNNFNSIDLTDTIVLQKIYSQQLFEGDVNNKIYVSFDSKEDVDAVAYAYTLIEGVDRSVLSMEDLHKPVKIVEGRNVIDFIVPDYLLQGTYYFYVTFVKNSGYTSPGVIGRAGNDDYFGSCTQTLYPALQDNIWKQKFLLHAKSMYYRVDLDTGEICPDSYEPQFSGDNLCVRDDLMDLGCMQLGCPVTVDYTYECTSSGLCAETVYKASGCKDDVDCEDSAKCDVETGVCWNEKVYENIIYRQCEPETVTSDCPVPCEGITTNCVDNRCVWNGECVPIEKTVFINELENIYIDRIIQCNDNGDCVSPCDGVSGICNLNKCEYDGACNINILTIPKTSEDAGSSISSTSIISPLINDKEYNSTIISFLLIILGGAGLFIFRK